MDKVKENNVKGMSGFRTGNEIIVRGNIGKYKTYESRDKPGETVTVITVASGGDKKVFKTKWNTIKLPPEVKYYPTIGQCVEVKGYEYEMIGKDRQYIGLKGGYIRFYEGSMDKFNEFPIE